MTGNGNTTAALVEALDELLDDDENLQTRSGLKLSLKLFREGMLIVGDMDKVIKEMSQAYIRFTNTNDAARKVEEENQRELAAINAFLPEIRSTMTILKWIGGIATAVLTALLIGIATGQLVIVRP